MFKDKRSKRVVLVAHCVLNQNSKLDRCAHFPGAIKNVADILIDSGVGLIQMPCPELLHLGLDREVEEGSSPTVEEEDSRIAIRMLEEEAKATCRNIADQLVHQIHEYQKNGFEVIGIVGMNGSPTCGVELTWSSFEEKSGPGVFIQILADKLKDNGITVEMKGVKAYEAEDAVLTVQSLLDAG